MHGTDTGREIVARLAANGMRCRIVSVDRIREIEAEIQSRRDAGDFDEHFYRIELEPFTYRPPMELSDAKSIIVAAAPQPQVRVSFVVEGTVRTALIPPTYSYATDGVVTRVLDAVLAGRGLRAVRAILPVKLLAARSGLVKYGKNNITYAEGLGSFHRLTVHYTNAPPAEDHWGEPRLLKPCAACTACMEACPTGAISPDRFLLRAERCITFINEFPGEFPAWLDPAWHNCIVGCLHCQRCCPVDSRVVDWIVEGETFSEEETAMLLRGVPEASLSAELAGKLERLGIIEYLGLLPRNLGAVLR